MEVNDQLDNLKYNNSNKVEHSSNTSGPNENSGDCALSYVKGNRSIKSKRRVRKKEKKLYFSFQHTVFLGTLWFIFGLTFIIGFLVHFETTKNVTASSIIWTFSIVICVVGILYSYNYYKCKHAKSEEELQQRLKYFPC